MTSREDLLDQYIDARIAGRSGGPSEETDPELQDLLVMADQLRADDETEWPEGDFPARLSRNLRAELNPVAPSATSNEGASGERSLPSGDGPAEPVTSAEDAQRGWRWYTRQFAGMAAAAVVVGLFGLGLAFILGDWGDGMAQPGAAVEPGQIPGTLLYTEYDEDQIIARIDADGTAQQDLASRPTLRGEAPGLGWSPDGEWVAFFDPVQQEQWSPAEISMVSADGTEMRQIPMDPVEGTGRLDTHLNWSPDGDSIAFVHHHAEHMRARIRVVHVQSGEAQTIGAPGDEPPIPGDSSPDWAPDGWTLAFSRVTEGGERSIQVIYEGMSEPVPLVEDDRRANQPEWSPDGESIAFVGEAADGERSSVYVVDVDSGRSDRITDREGRWDYSPAWSSRGQIAFMSDRGDRNYDIFVVQPDGSGLRNLTADYDWPAYTPNWSGDGRYLTFTSHDQDHTRWRINVYDMDRDQLYTVLESENPLYHAQWRPEGGPEETPEPTRNIEDTGEEVDPELLEQLRQSAELFLSEDDQVALTVDGREITAGQIDVKQTNARINRATMRESLEDEETTSQSMEAYQSGFLELFEEYGPENVGLGSTIARTAVLNYAEENDLTAIDQQIEDALQEQREMRDMVQERDPEGASAVANTLIEALGEDVYWNEYLPQALAESLTAQNVARAVTEVDDSREDGLEARNLRLAEFRADLVREAEIEVVDESALGEADLDQAIEYITEAYPSFHRSVLEQRQDRREQSSPTAEEVPR